MKRFNARAGRLFRSLGLRHLENEGGLMLVLTMVILLVLSSLAATNIINAYLERSLARNQHYSNVTLNAADAGLDLGLAWLNDDTNASSFVQDPGDPGFDPNWTQALSGSLASGSDYTVTMRFKIEDEFYVDGDGDTDELVLYNNCPNTNDGCWGFPDVAVYDDPNTGYPLIEIDSVSSYGNAGNRRVTMEVGRDGLEIKAFGAVTAASNVNTTGNIDIDGNAFDANGNPCTGANCKCDDDYPGVTVDDGMTVTMGGSADTGCHASDDPDPSTPECEGEQISGVAGGSIPQSADDALGLDGIHNGNPSTLADMFGGAPAPSTSTFSSGDVTPSIKVRDNITWVNADYNWSLSGTTEGIVIVSNPLFNPAVWRVSVPGSSGYDSSSGLYDPLLEAGYDVTKDPHKQTDPYVAARRPRNINQQGNGTHKGVVIADSIDKINGNCTIIGAMISLSTISVNTLGNGAANIKFSCDAINLAGDQGYSTKLAWRRRY